MEHRWTELAIFRDVMLDMQAKNLNNFSFLSVPQPPLDATPANRCLLQPSKD